MGGCRCRSGGVRLTSGPLCNGMPPWRAERGIRKSLDGLELCHGPRISGGDPGLRAVDGSDPPIRHASYGHGDGWDVRGHPTPRLGSLPVHQSLREGQRRPVTDSSRSCSAMPNGPMASRSATRCSAASKRHSNRLPAEGQPEAGKGARPRRRDGRSPSRRPGGPAPMRRQRRPRRRRSQRRLTGNRWPRPAVIAGRRENIRRLAALTAWVREGVER